MSVLKLAIGDGKTYVKDHDTYFVVTRLFPDGKKLKMRVKSKADHRAAMKAGNIAYFAKLLDAAIWQDERAKEEKKKAAKELEKVRAAVRAGIPIEQKALPRVSLKEPPRYIVCVMPWWKRLARWAWKWMRRPFLTRSVVVEVPKSMSMKPPAKSEKKEG